MTYAIGIRSPAFSADLGLRKFRPDALLMGDNDGVACLYDFGWLYCFPRKLPANADVVTDISEHANARFVVGAQSPGWFGGGIYFSDITNTQAYLEIPASVAVALASQSFGMMLYVQLPTFANWPALGAAAAPILTWTDSGGPYSEPDIVTIGMIRDGSGNRFLVLYRQTAAGTVDQTYLLYTGIHDGLVCQLGIKRSPAGTIFRLRSTAGTTRVDAAGGVDNTTFAVGKTGKIGIGPALWGQVLPSTANTFRICRFAAENLDVTQRYDYVSVLDADWRRFVSKPVYRNAGDPLPA